MHQMCCRGNPLTFSLSEHFAASLTITGPVIRTDDYLSRSGYGLSSADNIFMWTKTSLLSEAKEHTLGLTVLPPGAAEHPALSGVREVLRVAFRLSPVELGMLAVERAKVSRAPDGPPRGTPHDLMLHLMDVQSRAVARYHAGVSAGMVPIEGVCAVVDALHAAYLQPWLNPDEHEVLLRPFRAVLGPEHETGFGPRYAEIATVLGQAQNLSPSKIMSVARYTLSAPPGVTASLGAAVYVAAEITGRLTGLCRVEESLALLVEAPAASAADRRAVVDAGSLAAGSLLMADAVSDGIVMTATRSWERALAAR